MLSLVGFTAFKRAFASTYARASGTLIYALLRLPMLVPPVRLYTVLAVAFIVAGRSALL